MEHQGGELAVRRPGNTHTFDWAINSDESLVQWAAFSSDCEHEVFEVRSGHRITLTYNLYATAANGDLAGQASAFSPTSLPLYNQILAMLTSDKFKSKDRLLGLYKTHAYPHTEQNMAFRSASRLCAILENPIGYEKQKLDDGEFSDEDTDANSMEKKKELAEELDPEDDPSSEDYNPSRVVGVLSKVCATDMMVEDDSQVQNVIEWAVETQKIKFDASKIVWLNQSNAGKKVQASYIARFNVGERINDLDVGFDGCKITDSNHYSGPPSVTQAVSIFEDSLILKSSSAPLAYAVSTLRTIRPALDRAFGCQMPGEWTKEIGFTIDGPGGELINAIEILREDVVTGTARALLNAPPPRVLRT
ncbi:oxidoreductase [Colletotrichum salicis]|uniref:Oxidoreductase n=1 Tax=Colletotrichum salicis TaxID=1209931 RepID=A0A135V644_9PEZI|nr:oxidoreductase [Colletotrichum salicis]